MSSEIILLFVLALLFVAFYIGLLIGIRKKKKLEEKIVQMKDEMQWEHSVILKLERELEEMKGEQPAFYNIGSAQIFKMNN
jgi:hypothetical protein